MARDGYIVYSLLCSLFGSSISPFHCSSRSLPLFLRLCHMAPEIHGKAIRGTPESPVPTPAFVFLHYPSGQNSSLPLCFAPTGGLRPGGSFGRVLATANRSLVDNRRTCSGASPPPFASRQELPLFSPDYIILQHLSRRYANANRCGSLRRFQKPVQGLQGHENSRRSINSKAIIIIVSQCCG